MGGLYTHQKVERRRYLPHLNIRQDGSVMSLFNFTFGVFRIIKLFFCTIALLFLSFGKKMYQIIKEFLLRVLDIIRFNPFFRKITIGFCLSSFFVGAIFLVFFAIISPELPPQNLFSAMRDISEGGGSNGFSMSNVVLSANDDNWAALTLFDGKEFETGAGSQTQDRSKDFDYPVRPGETLSEIAYAYGIPYDFLAWYNKIENANRIRVGTVIVIPSLENIALQDVQYRQQRTRQQQTVTAARAVKDIGITYESINNGTGAGITVHFSIVNPPSNLRSYEWDLGDGRRSFRESPSHEYSTPRTYTVRLTAQDSSGGVYRSNHLYIDIPHPASAVEHSTTRFITLSYPDEHFVVNGTITKVSRHANIHDVLDFSESDQFLTKVQFKKSGYYGITVREAGDREQYYSVFVSPIPSVHVDHKMNNFNWYRTQFNTGTPSNCGPASVAMGISWATGRYFPVSSARQAVGWQGNGGTSFDELIRVIRNQGIEASLKPLRTVQEIKDVIDAGSIAIILFHTDGIRMARGNPAADLFGKYYNDSTGHYMVVKGYSMNGEYFIVHDPIPSDWSANSFRYSDEISMMGRNRYFSANEVLRSLRRNEMIVVSGPR
ncbi:MAG: LysM peptidoglycan-binding domain-containing protein [Treponema sp.]|jgi:murein DD-endopeptidase MepM/ murein hydrolase activator NlpD|nr:LysM peptidoglycan-binding domain-containing protein [Treponema sp.]